ncbi:glycosyl hydrolase family 32 [Georgenia sp. EYE_87]|uniref:glycosyl hydrolase family 32 n=1 Tax=Georgenia sp. EYE_87 TaxID=2853448 RepID=UPI0020042EDB|nr:glycosyl hydrolase family 32 [Georgenia sp. EYE_87]MCK6211896.1 glycosyl hydrolase family 32 [Georgenia sp. EYE_87]
MGLQLDDKWIWDFWFAVDGREVHVFYLQAPRSLGDPDLRHHRATVGHAVSTDLRSWTLLPDALAAGPAGEFDDLATWTGCVVRHGDRWQMFYTGVSRAEQGRVQRVGLASSTDLIHWERHGAVLEADPRWYEVLHPGVREEAWRDPWVFRDEASGLFHMLLTARAPHGPVDGRGVVGHATSDDLVSWTAGPPLSEPGDFYHLEVPQLVNVGGAWQVLFCATAADQSAARTARGVTPQGGTHYLRADTPTGPYTLADGPFLVGDDVASRYAGRILRHDGEDHFFAWENVGADGRFVGALSDPLPVTAVPDGGLAVMPSAAAR